MKRRLLTASVVVALSTMFLQPSLAEGREFEVWIMDQSGAAGTLHIFDQEDVRVPQNASAESLDLGGLCPGAVRGHMIEFNESGSHAIIAFVATGHVLFMTANDRQQVTCIDVGTQAHAAMPSPDDTHVLAADQNGKKLHRINTDADGDGTPYENANDIAFDAAATLDLATCTTPSGAACQDPTTRPDNAPICPIFDRSGRRAFVTLRGGGLFVVDTSTTPISIVAEYDNSTIHPNGCGGVEAAGNMFITSGGPGESHLYSFDLSEFPDSGSTGAPNVPAPKEVFGRHGGSNDGHGLALLPREGVLWAADRFSNEIEVVDPSAEEHIRSFGLTGRASSDPAPDLIVPVPSGNLVLASLRGECPLTANSAAFNNAVGNTPGLGIIRIGANGRTGRLTGVLPILNPAPAGFDCPARTDDAPGTITNQADPHGIAIRPTGS